MTQRKRAGGEADRAGDSAREDDLADSVPSDAPVPPPPGPRRSPSRAPPPMQAADPDRGEPPARARSLGKYQFIATLGRGGMADVHLAVVVGPAGFNKLQVIKCIRPAMADEPELQDMLLDEARLAARLNHRNIVQTNEVGETDGQYFLAMEYLDGQPLSRIILRARERERTIPLAISLWILAEALAGLHYAHELTDYDGSPLHVVHRDVSPHNVFVTYDGQVKVVDFGIALAARRIVETQTGTLKGKVAYMAPEQAFSPSSEIDRRADVFSVGVMLWELVAGRRLWRGLSDPQIISRLMRDVPDIRTARPDAPFELARVCGRALARSRDDRYSTAAELRTELERYIERLGEQVTAAQVGELVSELFAEERAEIRAIVDRQLKKVQDREAAASDGEPPGRRSYPSLPAFVPRDPDDEDPAVTAVSRVAPAPTPTPALGAVVPFEATRARGRAPLLAGVAVALLGGALLLLQLREPAGGAAPEPPAPAPAATRQLPAPEVPAAVPQGAAPRGAPDAAYVRAKIVVTPPDAKILVDGSELPSNPFEGKFIKDDAAHRIEMQANGFIAQRRMIVFDKDFELEVILYVAPRGAAPGATAAPQPTAAPGEALPPPKPDPY